MAQFTPAKMQHRFDGQVISGHRHSITSDGTTLEVFIYREDYKWKAIHHPTGWPIGGSRPSSTRRAAIAAVSYAIAKHGGKFTKTCIAECMAKPDRWPFKPVEPGK